MNVSEAELARYKAIESMAGELIIAAHNAATAQQRFGSILGFEQTLEEKKVALSKALATTPDSALEQIARKEEYVKALEEIVSVSRVVLQVGKFRGSQRADEVASHLSELLTNLDANLAAIRERKV